MNFNINDVISNLKMRQPCFVSERHLQVEFALETSNQWQTIKCFPEYTFKKYPNEHLDLLIKDGNTNIGIEFKYIQAETNELVEINDMAYLLKDHSAVDQRRYDCLDDLSRLEKQKREGLINKGYLVVITNEQKMWDKEKTRKDVITCDQYFKMFDGIKAGDKDWKPGTSDGTKGKRKDIITINNDYSKDEVKYNDYSDVTKLSSNKITKNAIFKYQIIKVK